MPTHKIERILFATDLMASSRLALDYAVAFALHFHATIVMAHALELSYPAQEVEAAHLASLTRKQAQERVDTIANQVRRAGINVETLLEAGIPAEVIPQAVDVHAIDLLVMGVYGMHRGLAHLLVGSNTEKILLSAMCPTMTVGAHVLAGVDPALHFDEILDISDSTAEAAVAGAYAQFLGKEFGAPVNFYGPLIDSAEHQEVRQHLPSDHLASAAIVDLVRSRHSGLIVLGIHAESFFDRHLHTSLAYQLLARATCPVISVRSPSDHDGAQAIAYPHANSFRPARCYEKLKIRQILFATDFLASSRLALDYAVAIAHHFAAELWLLHAVELPPEAEEAELRTWRPSISRQSAEERLESFAAGVRRLGLRVKTIVVDGTPGQVILNTVKADHPDLLVIGVQGVHRGLNHLVVGSNTEKILLSTDCPTLSVGVNVIAGGGLDLKLNRILYCSDFTPEAASALPYAWQLGADLHVPVEICQLCPEPPSENHESVLETATRYCDALRRIVPDAAGECCTPEFHLKRGMSVDEILRRAESELSGLIVLGIKAESQFARHLHTSFAYQLLTRAVCPVLSIRSAPAPA
jgi:nucleotide-binding universal stress UspA family protein